MSDGSAIRPVSSNPHVARAVIETRRHIEQMDQRILRQKQRVDQSITDGSGPRQDMEALLDDMIKTREILRKQLEGFEQEHRNKTDDPWPPINAVSSYRE